MPSEALQLSFALRDIRAAAQELWRWANGARVFTFSGSLGAGKTTFIHALCDDLGVKDTVSSPTFALINEYRFPVAGGGEKAIYHMDWYRVRDAEEAVDAGMEDALNNPDAICFIEWPEKAPELLSIPHVRIQIDTVSETERALTATRDSKLQTPNA
jgi:tRNA threonylcarbamoyladenosine biosynthesis protein TsaE